MLLSGVSAVHEDWVFSLVPCLEDPSSLPRIVNVVQMMLFVQNSQICTLLFIDPDINSVHIASTHARIVVRLSCCRRVQVILGASAVLSNGTVVSRAGTAAVAMMAGAHNVPVMVCSETCKFHDQVQLDSFTQNELGDPRMIATVDMQPQVDCLKGWETDDKLHLLNLKYDLMPAEYVSLIVTELGMIPTTSVQVILREYKQES